MTYDCMAIAVERLKLGDRRSAEYQRGLLEALEHRLNNVKPPRRPWPEGSVHLDAYWAGWDAGALIAQAERERTEAGTQ